MTLVNAYSTLRDVELPDFASEMLQVRGLDDPELAPHLDGFKGYVSNFAPGMTPTVWHLLGHIGRTQNTYSFEVANLETSASTLEAWCLGTNSIVFLPDGTVRDPKGAILCSQASQEIDPEAEIPWPPEAWARKARTEAFLKARGLEVPDLLPPVVSDREVVLRTSQEVASRLLALLIVAIRADEIAHRRADTTAALQREYGAGWRALSPEEADFLKSKPKVLGLFGGHHMKAVTAMTWRLECAAVLLWALGKAELPFPEAGVGLRDVAAIVEGEVGQTLVANTELRPVGEILDALDLHYRLHWRARQSNQEGLAIKGYIPDVVWERHYALNWLVRHDDTEWDDVKTPT